MLFFRHKSDEESVGQVGGRTDASLCTTAVFFSSYKLPKTVTLLFGYVKLLSGTFFCN